MKLIELGHIMDSLTMLEVAQLSSTIHLKKIHRVWEDNGIVSIGIIIVTGFIVIAPNISGGGLGGTLLGMLQVKI